MKKLSVYLLFILLISCFSPPKKDSKLDDNQIILNYKNLKEEIVSNDSIENFNELKNILQNSVGKYSFDVKLFENRILENRLKTLFNERYNFLKQTWSVETPIKFENGMIIMTGCEQHNCYLTNFIIIFNSNTNKFYGGVREEGNVELFKEDEKYPERIYVWERNIIPE